MNVSWDVLLRKTIEAEIDAINRDPVRQTIRDMFEPLEAQSRLRGITAEIIKFWKLEPPKVSSVLHWGLITEPGIFVDKGTEIESEYLGMSEEVYDSPTRPGVIHEYTSTFSNPDLFVWIMTKNAWWTEHLYYIVRDLILKNKLEFARNGIRINKFQGGNIDRNSAFLPNNMFPRMITIAAEYEISIPIFEECPIGQTLSATFNPPSEEEELS